MPQITLKRINNQILEELLHINNIEAGKNTSAVNNFEPATLSYAPRWDNASQTFGIYIEDELVGVYCMSSTPDSDALWLGGYLIEQRYRAYGYGQTTLIEIIKKITQEHPYCNTINLAIEPEQVVAQRLSHQVEIGVKNRLNR